MSTELSRQNFIFGIGAETAEQFAEFKAKERGECPVLLKTTRCELEKRGVKLAKGPQLTDAEEWKILPGDFYQVGPGVFEAIPLD